MFQISRTTLTRAGLRLYSFTSCIPALRNYKALYFDILRALQERQDVIVDSENLKGTNTFALWVTRFSPLTCGHRPRQPATDAPLSLACDPPRRLVNYETVLCPRISR